MDIAITADDDVIVLTITGRVDSLSADQLTSAFAQPIAQGRQRLVADFAQVTYTSSCGLRSLLITVKECRRAGGDLRLAALQPEVERVMSFAGFTDIMQVFPDAAAAVASYRAA